MGWRSLFSSPSYGLFSRRRGVIMAPNYRRRLYFFWYKKSDVYMQCQGQFLTVVGVIKSVVAIFYTCFTTPVKPTEPIKNKKKKPQGGFPQLLGFFSTQKCTKNRSEYLYTTKSRTDFFVYTKSRTEFLYTTTSRTDFL